MAKLLSIDDKRGPGRPPAITREMLPIIEDLAAEGATDLLIAAYLNVHPHTIQRARHEENSAVLAALKEGRRKAIAGQLKLAHKWAQKNVIGSIHRTKWLLGQHDPSYLDQTYVQHSGNVSVTVVEGIAGPHSSQPVIEAEYEDLGQSKSPAQDIGVQHADPTSDVGESGR